MHYNSDAVARAKALALARHAAQVDNLGVPYAAHLEHIARIVFNRGPEFEVTAWLHDIVEDCDVSLEDIEAGFGPVIRRAVDAMTRREGEGYFSQYLPRLMQSPIAIVIKHADASHNLAKGHLLDDKEAALSLRGRYVKVISRLVDAQPQLMRQACFERIVYNNEKWIED